LISCGGESDTDVTEFAEATPSYSMVELSMDSEVQKRSLSTDVEKEKGQSIRTHAQNLMHGLNELIKKTHTGIDELVENSDPIEITSGKSICKQWTATKQATWKVTICKKDIEKKKFSILIEAKKLNAGESDKYITIASGHGNRLPKHDGKRRGFGRILYNFDNLSKITGDQIGGKLRVAYRAAGKVRNLRIGMHKVTGPNLESEYSAKYKYTHIIGKGGVFKYVAHYDFLTEQEGEITKGEDGKKELIRVASLWNTSGYAIVNSFVCGGTLKNKKCYRNVECWKASGELTFKELIDEDGDVTFEKCEKIEMENETEPPSDQDLNNGTNESDDTNVETPEQHPDED